VSRLLFVYCAAEGGDKPRVCEQVGKIRSSPAAGGMATGPGVTVRIWRVMNHDAHAFVSNLFKSCDSFPLHIEALYYSINIYIGA